MSTTPNVIVNRMDQPAPRESWWKYLLRLAGIVAFATTIGAITLAVWSVLLGSLVLGSLMGSTAADDTQDVPTSVQDATGPENDAQAVPAPTGSDEGLPVVLEVTTTVPAEVRWNDASSGNTVPEPVTGTWKQELTTDPDGFNYFSVDVSDSNGDPAAEVSCRIVVDGEELDAAQGVGEYASANCSSS